MQPAALYVGCICTSVLAQYCFGDQIEKNEMGGACRRKAYTGFWWGILRERDQFGDPGLDGRIILRWIFKKWDAGTGTRWLRRGTGSEHL